MPFGWALGGTATLHDSLCSWFGARHSKLWWHGAGGALGAISSPRVRCLTPPRGRSRTDRVTFLTRLLGDCCTGPNTCSANCAEKLGHERTNRRLEIHERRGMGVEQQQTVGDSMAGCGRRTEQGAFVARQHARKAAWPHAALEHVATQLTLAASAAALPMPLTAWPGCAGLPLTASHHHAEACHGAGCLAFRLNGLALLSWSARPAAPASCHCQASTLKLLTVQSAPRHVLSRFRVRARVAIRAGLASEKTLFVCTEWKSLY